MTAQEIDNLQNYYGRAIRDNTNSVENMRRAIWATYFHKLSTDDRPLHNLCPPRGPGTKLWCKYNNEPSKYKHHGLPEEVMLAIKPIYRDLSHPDLLKKCLHGKTQNVNESFNSVVWTRIPKTVFVGLKTMKMGVFDAILSFNNGNIGRARVLQHLGIDPGCNTLRQLRAMDQERVKKCDIALEELNKEARQKNRNLKRKGESLEEPEYVAGGF